MNRSGGTMPEHGMSREEADELVRDLTTAGIEVVRVDEVRNRPRYIVGEVYGDASTVAHADAVTRPLRVPVTADETATTPHAARV